MAGETGFETSELKERLLTEGRRFSFVQAFRILQYIISADTGKIADEQTVRDTIRVRPDLSLDFPESDIISVDDIGDVSARYRITATFLGLYGSSSPLPTFYTEDLLDEQSEDSTASRDFIDIFHTPLYYLFFKIWSKYRLFYQIAEKRDAEVLDRLFCLIGLENEKLREQVRGSYSYLRYTGLLTQFPRSAEGLRAILSDRLGMNVDIIQCVPRYAQLPEDQRARLGVSGNTLGVDCYLGREIVDRMGKFRVMIGPVDGDGLHRLLPDQRAYADIADTIRFYLDRPLVYDIEIGIESDTIEPARTGKGSWTRLGWDTWLGTERLDTETENVRFVERAVS